MQIASLCSLHYVLQLANNKASFCDRENKPLFHSLAAFSTEACRDRHEAAAQGTELFVVWFGFLMWLFSSCGKWCPRLDSSSKYHFLKTSGCFTFVKKKRGSSAYIVYSLQFEFGGCFGGFFCCLKYLCVLLSAVYVVLSRQVFSSGDMLTSKNKVKEALQILTWNSGQNTSLESSIKIGNKNGLVIMVYVKFWFRTSFHWWQKARNG